MEPDMGRFGSDDDEQPESTEALPTIVTGPGVYMTRAGKKAEVSVVRTNNTGPDFYPAKGTLDGKFTCWTRAGRFSASGPHLNDLLRKLKPLK